MIHIRLNFKTNFEKACEKAARVNAALYRIMANVVRPNQTRRLLLAKITQFITMYAVPVRELALGIRVYARAARFIFCLSALKVASGFHTVSYEAIGVISDINPPDVMAVEYLTVVP